MTSKAFDEAFSKWIGSWKKENISKEMCELINQANYDLYHGPVADDEDYPGFESACKTIAKAIEGFPSSIYLNEVTGDVTESEPEDASDWWLVEGMQLLQGLVGKELAVYLR